MKYILIIVAALCLLAGNIAPWFWEGNEAVAAASQVGDGLDYLMARAQMDMFHGAKLFFNALGGIFLVLFTLTLRKKKVTVAAQA